MKRYMTGMEWHCQNWKDEKSIAYTLHLQHKASDDFRFRAGWKNYRIASATGISRTKEESLFFWEAFYKFTLRHFYEDMILICKNFIRNIRFLDISIRKTAYFAISLEH